MLSTFVCVCPFAGLSGTYFQGHVISLMDTFGTFHICYRNIENTHDDF